MMLFRRARKTDLDDILKLAELAGVGLTTLPKDKELLRQKLDWSCASELCTLFLNPAFRHDSNGLLLSRARFLFMAHFSQRFVPLIIVELRGSSDELGHSPFWEQVGRHFFHMTFYEADYLTQSTNKQFIADLMPTNPIYVKLLDTLAQAVIGKPHQSTIPAMKILLNEGFVHNGYVDIFDAGPILEANLNQVRTIENSRIMKVESISDDVSSEPFLLANNQLDFRATLSKTVFNPKKKTCIINKETANLLEIHSGDYLRVAPLRLSE
jgi:arginine N-succinyltransferase